MNGYDLKLTRNGATLRQHSLKEESSMVVDKEEHNVSHETLTPVHKSFNNPLKQNIPVLTDLVDDVVMKSLTPHPGAGSVPDFSSEKIFGKNYRTLNLLEQAFHSDLHYNFQKAENDNSWLKFLGLLNQVHSQGLFFSDYYTYWVMRVLSTQSIEAYKHLSLPFVWLKICELDKNQVFELVKPTFETLYYSKSLEQLFYLTDSLISAGIPLPQEWLINLTKFNYFHTNNAISKSFSELLARNCQI